MYTLSAPFSPESADTYFDMERPACPQPAAFLSRRARLTPSTYVYASFVSDLVLAKSVAVGKTLGKLHCSIACCTGWILRGQVAPFLLSPLIILFCAVQLYSPLQTHHFGHVRCCIYIRSVGNRVHHFRSMA